MSIIAMETKPGILHITQRVKERPTLYMNMIHSTGEPVISVTEKTEQRVMKGKPDIWKTGQARTKQFHITLTGPCARKAIGNNPAILIKTDVNLHERHL